MAKKAKVVTGAQAAAVQEIRVQAVEKPKRDLKWFDYNKAASLNIMPDKGITINTYKTKKTGKRIFVVRDIATNKWLAVVGSKNDGSGIYVQTEFEPIQADVKQAVKEVATV